MEFIIHRVNKIKDLKLLPKKFGVEIDIRNHGNELLVVHDPFITEGINLSKWLVDYDHKFLIVNVKEEGLEPQLLEILSNKNINNFFILDESFPYIRKYALAGTSSFALRVSEFESVETALNLDLDLKKSGNRVGWIWLDTFTGLALPNTDLKRLREAGFKLCQVSPELHYISDIDSWESRIREFQKGFVNAKNEGIEIDMVCTKRPDLW